VVPGGALAYNYLLEIDKSLELSYKTEMLLSENQEGRNRLLALRIKRTVGITTLNKN